MRKTALLVASLLTFSAWSAFATQADDTTITITGQTDGPTPFIRQLSLAASDTSVLKSIQFTIAPKPGSVTRALSGTYSQGYMATRGYLVPPSTESLFPFTVSTTVILTLSPSPITFSMGPPRQTVTQSPPLPLMTKDAASRARRFSKPEPIRPP